MKKIKYRNNNYNSQVYSINYKFDSISPAGKCSGTALDLIKKYNELAKEAHSNGDYVEAEVFRQYAEHYRKIITEINERKNIRFNTKEVEQNTEIQEESVTKKTDDSVDSETVAASPDLVDIAPKETSLVETKPKNVKKEFTIIDVSIDASKKKKYRPRTKKISEEVIANE